MEERQNDISEEHRVFESWYTDRASEMLGAYGRDEFDRMLNIPKIIAESLPFGPDIVRDVTDEQIGWLAQMLDLQDDEKYGRWINRFIGLNLDAF
jgi:hypothetical protein